VNTTAAIEVKGLDKTYASTGRAPAMQALKSVDMTIPRGSIFGLLGPNGAGKSTFINILAGMVIKSAGSVRVWGFDIDENPRNVAVSIGVVPQELSLDAFFTPRELLELQAGLYAVPKDQRRTREILQLLQLEDKADAYARTLSGGMKRRLMVGKAMVHSPPILVLDEPTAGVDIELRKQLWDNVRELNANGVTIVLTTHYLEEAEALCDQIAIINHGEVVACEDTRTLLARIDEKELIVDTTRPVDTLPEALLRFNVHKLGDSRICFQINKSTTTIQDIIGALGAADIGIRDLSTNETDLEDVFLQLTKSA
jgi:ABC-2 type transport system ATP-binding protein